MPIYGDEFSRKWGHPGFPIYMTSSDNNITADRYKQAINSMKNYAGDTDGDEKMIDCSGEFRFVTKGLEEHIVREQINELHQKKFTPVRIIFNDPATIVFWEDGTKTVVKCAPGTPFNKYAGFCAAVAKKVYVNNSVINRLVSS